MRMCARAGVCLRMYVNVCACVCVCVCVWKQDWWLKQKIDQLFYNWPDWIWNGPAWTTIQTNKGHRWPRLLRLKSQSAWVMRCRTDSNWHKNSGSKCSRTVVQRIWMKRAMTVRRTLPDLEEMANALESMFNVSPSNAMRTAHALTQNSFSWRNTRVTITEKTMLDEDTMAMVDPRGSFMDSELYTDMSSSAMKTHTASKLHLFSSLIRGNSLVAVTITKVPTKAMALEVALIWNTGGVLVIDCKNAKAPAPHTVAKKTVNIPHRGFKFPTILWHHPLKLQLLFPEIKCLFSSFMIDIFLRF